MVVLVLLLAHAAAPLHPGPLRAAGVVCCVVTVGRCWCTAPPPGAGTRTSGTCPAVVEPGEALQTALERELAEELGVGATVTGTPFARVRGEDFLMAVWVPDRWVGDPVNQDPAEHDDLAWLTATELGALRLADPRLPELVRNALAQP